MFNLLVPCFIFLVATQCSTVCSADGAAIADPVSARVEGIRARMAGFVARDYDEEADGLARITITEVLACPERDLSAAENAALVDAFLKTELFQAFNTRFGSTRTHRHRIIYDFIKGLEKGRVVSPQEKSHLTKFTVLSLAAQEFFWNPKSTIEDLKMRVIRELRFGLFRQADNPLNVAASIYLPGLAGQEQLRLIVNEVITDELRDTLNTLVTQFREDNLGNIYQAVLANLRAAQKAPAPLNLADISATFPELLRGFGIEGSAASYPSSGAGHQCGFNSLFIQTENAVHGSGPGTAREKMVHAIEDDVRDPILRKLYLFGSVYSDPSLMQAGNRFEVLLARQKAIAAGDSADKEQAAQNVMHLEKVKAQYFETKEKVSAQREATEKQAKEAMIKAIFALKEDILDAFDCVMEAASTGRAATWADSRSPKFKSYRDFQGLIAELKISECDPEDFFEAKALENHLVFDFFETVCSLVEADGLVAQIEEIVETYRAIPQKLDEETGTIERDFLTETVLPLMEAIDPATIDDAALVEHAKDRARDEGINHLLECRSPYVQLWAKRNNLNVVVFSSKEFYGYPPVDIIMRVDGSPYSNLVGRALSGERRLATVILTSLTAKTLFLTKSPGHYDKLIPADDFASIAEQIRQTNLMAELNPPIDLHKAFDAAAFLASIARKPRRAFDAVAFLGGNPQ
jgi:hypothetical protein